MATYVIVCYGGQSSERSKRCCPQRADMPVRKVNRKRTGQSNTTELCAREKLKVGQGERMRDVGGHRVCHLNRVPEGGLTNEMTMAEEDSQPRRAFRAAWRARAKAPRQAEARGRPGRLVPRATAATFQVVPMGSHSLTQFQEGSATHILQVRRVNSGTERELRVQAGEPDVRAWVTAGQDRPRECLPSQRTSHRSKGARGRCRER